MPLVARSISSSICLRLNGSPSAVPCTSTSRPSPVMQTFMSTAALDSHGAPARAFAQFARRALPVGARDHRVFSGNPARALPLEERGHLIFDGRGADDARVAYLDQARALRVLEITARDADRPQLGRPSAVGSYWHSLLLGVPNDREREIAKKRRRYK